MRRSNSTVMAMGLVWRKTFRQILEETRFPAAVQAWRRAETASRLRHLAYARGTRRAAQVLFRTKRQAIIQTLTLCPEASNVTLDDDYHVGMLSVRFQNRCWLHLPPTTRLPRTGRRAAPALSLE